jgi:hypothetical protein
MEYTVAAAVSAANTGAAENVKTDSTPQSEIALASGEWKRNAGVCINAAQTPDWVRRKTGSLIHLSP